LVKKAKIIKEVREEITRQAVIYYKKSIGEGHTNEDF
jgi:hypothetical protein